MKKIINVIGLFFSHIIGDVETFLHNHVSPAKKVLELFKKIVDSKVANIFVALTPTDVDDKVRAFVSNLLTKAIDGIYISADIFHEPDWTTKVIKTIEYVKQLSPSLKGKFFADLERELVKQSANNPLLKDNVIDSINQLLLSYDKGSLNVDNIPDKSDTAAAPVPAPTAIKAAKTKKVKA